VAKVPGPDGENREPMMKVLVVDDDPTVRRILGRLLVNSFGVQVVEATNGLEGLVAIERDIPDLVLMDVSMPIVDGPAMLKSIRSTPAFRHLPAVAVSSMSDRALIMRLIDLGIAEFLLKPVDVAAASKRLARVIDEVKRQGHAKPDLRRDPGRRKLVLIESDPNFRQLFQSVLESWYDVSSAGSGPSGLQLAVDQQPAVVCLAEGLSLLNEHLVARHLRTLPNPPSRIYLLHAGDAPEVESGLFDGMLKKSFVPETMSKRWVELSGGGGVAAVIMETLRGSLQAEIVSATEQALGVMTQQEITRLSDDVLETMSRDVMPTMTLMTIDGQVSLPVGLFSAREDAERLAGKMGDGAGAAAGESSKALAQLVETIGGRVQSSFEQRGIRLLQQPVSELEADKRPTTWGFCAAFETATGERFGVGVGLPQNA
jgi:CheY-like chemotaxis protein